MTSQRHTLRTAPRSQVRLTDPALAGPVRADRTYLMSLDSQNLLQNFLLEAGRLSIRIHNFDDAFGKYHRTATSDSSR